MRTVIGLMSGTSMDGIDAALLRTDGRAAVEPLMAATTGYDAGFRKALREVLEGRGDVAAVERDLTDRHAEAVGNLLAKGGVGAGDVDLVGFHGQTIAHDPKNGITRQIGDGKRLARTLGIPVVNDFRAADVAAGGEGAPFAPLFHAAVFAAAEKPLAILNMGGIANVTWIGAGFDPAAETPDDKEILAFDTGPANALIDDVILAETGEGYDRDGALARAGTVDEAAVAAYLAGEYFSRKPPKSADRLEFPNPLPADMPLADRVATLAAITAATIARAADFLPAPPKRWLVTGGGRHNGAMMDLLAVKLGGRVEPIEAAGWDGDAIEAQAFGYLAVRSVDGLPLSLPTTTGVARPTTGGVLHETD